MKWAVEIQKTGLEHRNLVDLLQGLGFELVDGVDFKAIYSPSFDELETASDVWEQVKKVRDAFVGPASIDTEFELGSVIDYSTEERKRHAFLEIDSLSLKMSVGSVNLTVSPPAELSPEELKKWEEDKTEQEYLNKLESQREKLEPVFFETRASRVLELLSIADHTGETLYKIYELMEQQYWPACALAQYPLGGLGTCSRLQSFPKATSDIPSSSATSVAGRSHMRAKSSSRESSELFIEPLPWE